MRGMWDRALQVSFTRLSLCSSLNAALLVGYRSETKFDSGCGWPAFYDEIPGRNSHSCMQTTMTNEY